MITILLAVTLATAPVRMAPSHPVHSQPVAAAHLVCTTRQPAPASLRDLWNWMFGTHTRKRWLNAPVS